MERGWYTAFGLIPLAGTAIVRAIPDAFSMSEPHWKKRRREAMKRKHDPSFYAKQAVKPPSSWEFTSFWGHKGLQRRFGKVNGEKPKGLDG